MKIKSERDFWSGLMFVVLGVAFAIGATHYSMGPACEDGDPCGADLWARWSQLSTHPGPGFFPLGLGVLLTLLGAVVLFKSLTIESEGGDPLGAFAWRPLVLVVAAVAVFALLLDRAGLAVSTPVLIGVSSLAARDFRWKEVLVNAALLTVGAWLVLVLWLKLSIPMWPWWPG